jgi:hypothetical protein
VRLTGGNEHDDADNTCRKQRGSVTSETELAEDRRSVVENGVDAGPLLEEHGDSGNDDALEHGLGLEEGADSDELELEGVPGGQLGEMRELLGNAALLEHGLGLDLEEFELNQFVVLGKLTEGGEGAASFVFTAVVDEPSRRERHPKHTDEKNGSGYELNADGHEPGSIGLIVAGSADVVGSIVDPEGDHDTEGNGQLLAGYKSTTNLTVVRSEKYNKTMERTRLTEEHILNCT